MEERNETYNNSEPSEVAAESGERLVKKKGQSQSTGGWS
jgi:hypothetical protein